MGFRIDRMPEWLHTKDSKSFKEQDMKTKELGKSINMGWTHTQASWVKTSATIPVHKTTHVVSPSQNRPWGEQKPIA